MPTKKVHDPDPDQHIEQNLLGDRKLQARAIRSLLKMAAKLDRDGVDVGADMRKTLKAVKARRRQ